MRKYKIVATHETHDFLGNDEVIVKMIPEVDFPNCATKYTKCCTDDKEFWGKLQDKVDKVKPEETKFKSEQIIPTKIEVEKIEQSDNSKLIRKKNEVR